MTNCVTITTTAGIPLRTPTDSKASSKDRLTMVANALSLPDKEEVTGRALHREPRSLVSCGTVPCSRKAQHQQGFRLKLIRCHTGQLVHRF